MHEIHGYPVANEVHLSYRFELLLRHLETDEIKVYRCDLLLRYIDSLARDCKRGIEGVG